MKTSFQKRLKNFILLLLLGFVVLFCFRLAYGYRSVPAQAIQQFDVVNAMTSSSRNFASIKYEVKNAGGGQGLIQVDQKYEKVAEISTQSSKFEEEEKQARQQIKQFEALIQFEQKQGNPGNRRLNLVGTSRSKWQFSQAAQIVECRRLRCIS